MSVPATVIARWENVNHQTGMSIIQRKLNISQPSIRARGIQIRSYRLVTSASNEPKKSGRNMFTARMLCASRGETTATFVEDPLAPTKQAKQENSLHTRWTTCVLGGTTPSSNMATPFDPFLQRVLLGSGINNTSASSAFWQQRPAAVFVEGFAAQCASTPSSTFYDWEVKLGTVVTKGGSAAGTIHGIIVEVTYLPLSVTPDSADFVKNFVTSLFPPQALLTGEVKFQDLSSALLDECGLSPTKDTEGKYEWTDKQSSFVYIDMFRREGIL